MPAAKPFAAPARAAACASFVFTNVDHDGMLDGPDLEEVARRWPRPPASGSVIFSGGIGSLADLEALAPAPELELERSTA